MKLRIVLNILLAVVLLGAGASAVGLLYAYRRRPTQRVARKVVPKVPAPPVRPRLNQSMEIVGYGSARPRVQLDITPQVTGVVVAKAPNFLSGKYVRKDQVLLRIDPTDYSLAVQRAERYIDLLKAQLARLDQEGKNLAVSRRIESDRVELAQEQLKKAVNLQKAGAGSQNEVDLAQEVLLAKKGQLQNIVGNLALIGPQRRQLEAQIDSAKVDLAQASVNLDRCTIRSSVAGRVLSCNAEVGQLVQSGGRCGQVYGTEIMEVPVSVLASDLAWIDQELLEMCKSGGLPADPARRIKASVEWRGPGNGPTVVWSGCVERIEAGLEAETRTATLVVRVRNPEPKGVAGNPTAGTAHAGDETSSPNDGGPMLEVNMFCKVRIFGRTVPRVYVLPRQAVLPDGGVYVVIDGRLRTRPVKVARFVGEEAMILPGGGIRDGDRVVIGAIARPVVGMRVEPVDAMPAGPDTLPAAKPAR